MRGSEGERRHRRGHKSGTSRTAFLGPRGFRSWRQAARRAFGAAQQFVFYSWGKGGRKGVKKVIWGLSDKVVFLFGVAPNLCFRPAESIDFKLRFRAERNVTNFPFL